jgi:hypothetical protein
MSSLPATEFNLADWIESPIPQILPDCAVADPVTQANVRVAGSNVQPRGDGELPTTLATGCAPGESGLTLLNLQFEGGLHVSGTSRQHLILFQQMTETCSFNCRFADRTVVARAADRVGGNLSCRN